MTLAALLILAGSAIPDVNVVLNALMLLAVVGGGIIFAPKAWSVAKLKAEVSARELTIQSNEETIRSLTARIDAIDLDLIGLAERADKWEREAHELQKHLAAAEARYEEAMKYTAPEATQQLISLMGQQATMLAAYVTYAKERDEQLTDLLKKRG